MSVYAYLSNDRRRRRRRRLLAAALLAAGGSLAGGTTGGAPEVPGWPAGGLPIAAVRAAPAD